MVKKILTTELSVLSIIKLQFIFKIKRFNNKPLIFIVLFIKEI